MSEQPSQDNQHPGTTTTDNKTLRILQINLNKSEKAHLELYNNVGKGKGWDVVLIQEPHIINAFNVIRTPTNYRPVFPADRGREGSKVRSVIWVSSALDTASWEIIDVPDTNDITAIQLKGRYGKITLVNVYNDCLNANSETAIDRLLTTQTDKIRGGDNAYMIWAGDFNRHHPLWDRDEDTHLFTTQTQRAAERLINLIAEYDMEMLLPKGIPTLEHMVTKRWSRPDNVFASPGIQDMVVKCDTVLTMRPPHTDHVPVATILSLPQQRTSKTPNYNFREADWEAFRKGLSGRLDREPEPAPLRTEEQLIQAARALMGALGETVEECVKRSKPWPHTKRWWNSDLKIMRKALNRLRAEAYKFRAVADHHSHSTLRSASNAYGEAIVSTKRQHWTSYLEDMKGGDIWTANKYLREPVGDGGTARIPTLKMTNSNNEEAQVSDNGEKAKLFAKVFFPPPPANTSIPPGYEYPAPLPPPAQLTPERIEEQIHRLSPYKAPGPDGVPNVVLQKCEDLIVTHLLYIFRAILELGVYYDPWREFTTVVLRKPGKPNYEMAKAHRPVVLLSTVAKVLTALVAEDMTRLVEHHNLLPKTHFGGRPGRTTTDAIHLMVDRIKEAWRNGQVASVLFLDVEGAFPNAVTDRLLHNLRRRKIPITYTNFITQLLTNRRTRLKFDDYTSDVTNITNGIGQGDPLSMLLYIIYNADLLEITGDENSECAIGYVDDVALIAVGQDFDETTRKLRTMMTKEDGGLQWSREHNSKFEVSKSAILHASRRTQRDPEDDTSRIPLDRPRLTLQGKRVKEVNSFKYLGIQIDSQLRWKEQAQRAAANATKWILQYRRLTRPSTGVSPKLMRQLYLAVALPKITYGLDVWYDPPTKPPGATKNSGSVGALKALCKVQRIATLAITGALRTTPTDLLDPHAGVLPMELALSKVCFRSTVRMLTLPEDHPNHGIIQKARQTKTKTHPGPIESLIWKYGLASEAMETIVPTRCTLRSTVNLRIEIAETREDSIEDEKNDSADFKVYADGSGQGGGIGAAAVMYKKGQRQPVCHRKAYLGEATKHNTFEGETVGAILATWIVDTTPGTVGKRVSIYIDNQSVLTSAEEPKATAGQHLIKTLVSMANGLGARLTLRWISSHSGVKGNERVDELAKEAAEGKASRRTELPPQIRRGIPTSASAAKQDNLERLKTSWKAKWLDSPRWRRLEHIDLDFPFSKYRARLDNVTRGQASRLMQIRSGHIPLNSYLFKIGKTDSPLCRSCERNPGERGPATETVNHFLFECRAYDAQRLHLANKVGRRNLNLKTLMQSTEGMRALASYAKKTGRLDAAA
jgi:ribonuclease HI